MIIIIGEKSYRSDSTFMGTLHILQIGHAVAEFRRFLPAENPEVRAEMIQLPALLRLFMQIRLDSLTVVGEKVQEFAFVGGLHGSFSLFCNR